MATKTDFLFFNEFNEEIIKKSNIWIIDGTFKCSPANFTQLIIVHFYNFNRSFPFVYILMQSKKEDVYFEIFNHLKCIFNFEPSLIIIDFKISLYNALTFLFLKSKINGCLFYFGQCICRKIQLLNASLKYKNDKLFQTFIKMHFNLAFISQEKVLEEYNKILKYARDKNIESTEIFTLYFGNTFLGSNKNEQLSLFSIFFGLHTAVFY